MTVPEDERGGAGKRDAAAIQRMPQNDRADTIGAASSKVCAGSCRLAHRKQLPALAVQSAYSRSCGLAVAVDQAGRVCSSQTLPFVQ